MARRCRCPLWDTQWIGSRCFKGNFADFVWRSHGFRCSDFPTKPIQWDTSRSPVVDDHIPYYLMAIRMSHHDIVWHTPWPSSISGKMFRHILLGVEKVVPNHPTIYLFILFIYLYIYIYIYMCVYLIPMVVQSHNVWRLYLPSLFASPVIPNIMASNNWISIGYPIWWG